MKQFRKYAFCAIVALPMFYFAGCRNAVQIPASFTLGGQLGTFEVTAGQSTQKSGTGDLGDAVPNIGSGKILLKSSDIGFTPANNGSGKGRTNMQSGGGSFTVMAGIAAFEDVNTVCSEPVDEYGPFTVTLNADNTVASISPVSITMEQTTIDLINGGAFSLCLTVESTVDGTVTIDALSFLLGL